METSAVLLLTVKLFRRRLAVMNAIANVTHANVADTTVERTVDTGRVIRSVSAEVFVEL